MVLEAERAIGSSMLGIGALGRWEQAPSSWGTGRSAGKVWSSSEHQSVHYTEQGMIEPRAGDIKKEGAPVANITQVGILRKTYEPSSKYDASTGSGARLFRRNSDCVFALISPSVPYSSLLCIFHSANYFVSRSVHCFVPYPVPSPSLSPSTETEPFLQQM
jgi:hypothetical protein